MKRIIKYFGYVLFAILAYLFVVFCFSLLVVYMTIVNPERAIRFMTAVIEAMDDFMKAIIAFKKFKNGRIKTNG